MTTFDSRSLWEACLLMEDGFTTEHLEKSTGFFRKDMYKTLRFWVDEGSLSCPPRKINPKTKKPTGYHKYTVVNTEYLEPYVPEKKVAKYVVAILDYAVLDQTIDIVQHTDLLALFERALEQPVNEWPDPRK